MRKELPLNTLESLSLPAINRLYRLQTDHFISESRNIKIQSHPFEYTQHEGLFHPEFYQYMKMLFPSLEQMDRYKDLEGVPDHYNEHRFALFIKDSKKGHEHLFKKISDSKTRYNYVRLYNWFLENLCTNLMDKFGLTSLTHTEFAMITDVEGFSLPAHTDIKQKIMTVLVYMPDNDDSAHSGTNILIPRGDSITHRNEDFTVVDTTRFVNNNTFAFRRSDHSYHSVTSHKGVTNRKFLLFTAISA